MASLSTVAPIIDFSRDSDFSFLPNFLQTQILNYGTIDNLFIISTILASLLFYAFVYYFSHIFSSIFFQTYRDYSKVPDKRKSAALRAQFNNLVASTVNAVAGFLYAYWSLSHTPELALNPSFGYTKFTHIANAFFLAYFIQDTYVTIKYARYFPNVPATIIHHICSILANGNCCFTLTLHQWSVKYLFMELSSPFLNLRWYLDQFKMKETLLYKLNGILITITFFYCRILFMFEFPFVQFNHLNELLSVSSPLKEWLVYWQLPTSLGAHLLNTYWFYLIVKGLIKTLRGGKQIRERPLKKIE